MTKLERKLSKLPKEPGVYFFKNKTGEIIYIGKAANLHSRVRQYFHQNRVRDAKTELLVSEITDVDWMETESEIDALFLEAEQVRRNLPRYNVLLRDDKSVIYIRIDYDSNYPTVTTTRRPLDDDARYFGPYLSASSIKQALKLLRRIFPYATKRIPGQKRASLHYHLGLDPGLEDGKTTLTDYRANLRRLMAVLQGKRKNIEKELEKNMNKYAKAKEFEAAAKIRNQLFALKRLNQQVVFGSNEFADISKDHALTELVERLKLKSFPKRIEGYDISHMSGSDVVSSMVVFTNGISDKSEYRKFKVSNRNRNDDFFNMYQTISRRFTKANIKKWGVPDLVLIDGGKGQVSSAIKAMQEVGVQVPIIGLAKRIETIIIPCLIKTGQWKMQKLNLPQNSHALKLLQRIRDESHRFAVSYHSTLKTKRQTASLLDEVPGIGPVTRKKLIRHFGSIMGIKNASVQELGQVIGHQKANKLVQYAKNLGW